MNHNELQEEYEKKLSIEMEQCKEKIHKISEELHHLKHRYSTISNILKCIDNHKNAPPKLKIASKNALKNSNLKIGKIKKNISWFVEIKKIFINDQNKHGYRTVPEIYEIINSDNRLDNSKRKNQLIGLAMALERAVKTDKMNLVRDGKRKLYGWADTEISRTN